MESRSIRIIFLAVFTLFSFQASANLGCLFTTGDNQADASFYEVTPLDENNRATAVFVVSRDLSAVASYFDYDSEEVQEIVYGEYYLVAASIEADDHVKVFFRANFSPYNGAIVEEDAGYITAKAMDPLNSFVVVCQKDSSI